MAASETIEPGLPRNPPSVSTVTNFFLQSHSMSTQSEGFTFLKTRVHDDVIKWEHFPRYLPFVRGIHRSPVNSLHKGQWRGVLMFSLICVWIYGWVNSREAGELRRYRAHYDVIVMKHGRKDQSKKSHNAPVPYLTIHQTGIEMHTFLFQSGVLWDMGQMPFGICDTPLSFDISTWKQNGCLFLQTACSNSFLYVIWCKLHHFCYLTLKGPIPYIYGTQVWLSLCLQMS